MRERSDFRVVTLLLSGGLGNQMFQYAAGKALALRNGSDLLLDLRFFVGATQPSKLFRLHEFAIEDEVRMYERGFFSSPHNLPQRLWRFARLEPFRTYTEPSLGFHIAATQLGRNAVLAGNFQSPLYFKDAENAVVESLQPISQDIRKIWMEDKPSDRINVHVRRGDYLHHQGFSLENPITYYEKAISAARYAHPGIGLKIFSDDPEWCKSQKIFKDAEIVIPNFQKSPIEDLAGMINCRAIIIANSSYSWWAGFLAGRRGIDVYAPRKWILNLNARDISIYPEYWTQI